jgi:quinolinate synthase
MNLELAHKNLEKNGYLDIAIDPSLDLFEEIKKLKAQKNAVILAHYYQDTDIQDIADYIGDSLGLSQQAAITPADVILFAGVHFMAETAKILSPQKKVLLPDFNAGCSLPDHIVISYVNCSAGIKALSDITCTSSNAVQIVNSLPKDQKIIFAPDKNLGRYVAEKTGRQMLLWDGSCMVHEIFSLEKIIKLKTRYPQAILIAHPECEQHILEQAQFIGSTTALLKYTISNPAQQFIVATETGILHQMQKNSPHKTFIPAPPTTNCACNDCPHMKLNTLEKIYLALLHEQPELTMPEDIRQQAYIPIKRMLDISEQLGL